MFKPTFINVPYLSQRNNPTVGGNNWTNTCNSSCHAMLLEYLVPGSISSVAGSGEAVDSYYIRQLLGTQDSTDHTIHTRILERFGVTSTWRYDLDYDDIDESLQRGEPVAIGVLHRGSIASPSGGHIILIVGSDKRDGKEGYVVNDPWGHGFSYQSENGKGVFYPKSPSLDSRWLENSKNKGWGRIVTAVNPKSVKKR